MNEPTLWVVAYDISDDGRRLKLARLLGSYGDRIQRSVFLIRLSTRQQTEMAERVRTTIAATTDLVHMFRFCNPCQADSIFLGQSPRPVRDLWWIT